MLSRVRNARIMAASLCAALAPLMWCWVSGNSVPVSGWVAGGCVGWLAAAGALLVVLLGVLLVLVVLDVLEELLDELLELLGLSGAPGAGTVVSSTV